MRGPHTSNARVEAFPLRPSPPAPHLSLPPGGTREAMTFYQSVFGGKLEISTFGDFNLPDMPADGVMHGALTTDAFSFMAAAAGPGADRVQRLTLPPGAPVKKLPPPPLLVAPTWASPLVGFRRTCQAGAVYSRSGAGPTPDLPTIRPAAAARS